MATQLRYAGSRTSSVLACSSLEMQPPTYRSRFNFGIPVSPHQTQVKVDAVPPNRLCFGGVALDDLSIQMANFQAMSWVLVCLSMHSRCLEFCKMQRDFSDLRLVSCPGASDVSTRRSAPTDTLKSQHRTFSRHGDNNRGKSRCTR